MRAGNTRTSLSMTGTVRGGVDLFVSYTAADRAWAEWIAWQPEAAGYQVLLQAWDFRPGDNFIQRMDQALAEADRVLAVLSPHYFASAYTTGRVDRGSDSQCRGGWAENASDSALAALCRVDVSSHYGRWSRACCCVTTTVGPRKPWGSRPCTGRIILIGASEHA